MGRLFEAAKAASTALNELSILLRAEAKACLDAPGTKDWERAANYASDASRYQTIAQGLLNMAFPVNKS